MRIDGELIQNDSSHSHSLFYYNSRKLHVTGKNKESCQKTPHKVWLEIMLKCGHFDNVQLHGEIVDVLHHVNLGKGWMNSY